MNSKDKLIQKLLEYLNTVTDKEVLLDELSITKDSICITEKDGSSEVQDVTSRSWVVGTLSLSIIFRGIMISQGIQDIKYTSELNTIVSALCSNYRAIQGSNFSVDFIKSIKTASLDTVYPDNTKDFKAEVQISYQRKLF